MMNISASNQFKSLGSVDMGIASAGFNLLNASNGSNELKGLGKIPGTIAKRR